MSKQIKKLAGQTLIYGLGTIVARFLNYGLLTIYYTRKFAVTEFGVITELYAYIALLLVILTYGMETALFRYYEGKESRKVYSTIVISIATSSLIFIVLTFIFLNPISIWLEYENYQNYILLLVLIVGIDAFSAIPFAKLRKDEKPLRFSILKLINVGVNVCLVLLFFEILPLIFSGYETKVIYVLIANLISSAIILLLLSKELKTITFKLFDYLILKKLLYYSLPLLITGMAGIINENLDRILLKKLLYDELVPMYQVGIYGANYKIAVLVLICIQMFRYAAEPFFFNNRTQDNAKKLYSDVMNVFVGIILIIILGLLLFIDFFKFFIDKKFHEGLHIVPIIALSYLFYGIFFNLSIWYKLKAITYYGIILTVVGGCITVAINVVFVPKYGYMASAWGHVVAYSVMVLLSYFLSRNHFRIKYSLNKLLIYIGLAIVIYVVDQYVNFSERYMNYLFNFVLLSSFVSLVVIKEKLYRILIRK